MERLEHSSTFPLTGEGDKSRSEATRVKGSSCRRATVAPASRYFTDRCYSVRRPLASAQPTWTLNRMETEKDVSICEGNQRHTDGSSLTSIEQSLESFHHSHSDISSSSLSREDLRSPLGVSELRTSVLLKPRTYESPFLVRTSAQDSLSCSILEVQRLNTPLRPPLTSTVLYPSYSPRTGHSRRGLTDTRGQDISCLPERPPKRHPLSIHQLNYRACAIPKSSPPSADRHSRDWDPNQEYQALLDYTYPLRPEQELSKWKSRKFQTKSKLQDSGIEVDLLCSSNSMLGLCFSDHERDQTRARSTIIEDQKSLEKQVLTDSSEALLSRTQGSQTDPVSLSVDSLRDRESAADRGSHQPQSPSSCPTFIRSTSILPCSRDAGGEVDDEFWHLPLELEEMKLLSCQVREVTTQLSCPVNSSWGSVRPHNSSVHSSLSGPVNQEAEGQGNTGTGRKITTSLSQIAEHRVSEPLERFGELEKPDQGRSDEDVTVLAEQLYVLKSPSSQRSSHQDSKQRDSLLQHIQMFSSHLEQLIQQLYSLSEKMELLATPPGDPVRSPLANQCFQGEVGSCQPLTSSVLHTGQLLLNCINTTSPMLRDTLMLIEKQSGTMERWEQFSPSIQHDPQTAGAKP